MAAAKKKTARKRRPTVKDLRAAQDEAAKWKRRSDAHKGVAETDAKLIRELRSEISRLDAETASLRGQVGSLDSDRYFYRSLFKELARNVMSAGMAANCLKDMDDYPVRQVCDELIYALGTKATELEKERMDEHEAKQKETSQADRATV